MIPQLILAAVIGITAEPDTASVADYNLNEVVVTGTRAPKLLKDTPVQTRLITDDDIHRADANDIEGLLQQEMPGVEFSYAMNQQTHMNFGGFGGQSVLFLVDGERLAGETMDDVDFSRLTMSGVERIEIVRGASSALYGSNAAGGVINIITRQPSKPWSVSANARLAKHMDQRYGVNVSARNKWIRNIFNLSYTKIDSYDVHSAPDPETRVFSTVYGNKTFNVNDRLTVTPTDNLKLSARAGFFFREIPRVIDTPERYRGFTGGLRGDWHITDRTNLDISYSFDQYDKSSYMSITGLDVRNYSDVVNSVRGILNHTLSNGDVFTAGADFRYDYLFNTKLEGQDRHETNADVFAQYDWLVNHRLELVGALRYDYFSTDNNSRVTPKISARYTPVRNLNIRLAYGMGFRTPTLKERFYNFDMAGIWIVNGNPDLKPETSHNINASVDWTHGHYNFTVTGYYNSVTDKISTGLPYSLPADPKQLYLDYINLDGYDVLGAEATLQARWNNGLSAKLSYAYTHESTNKDKEGHTANNQYIPARSHSLNARVEWHKAFSSNYELTSYISGRVLSGVTNREYKDYNDIAAGTTDVRYPAYTIWRLGLSQIFIDKIKLNITVDNLFNYRPKYYYLNAPLTDGINLAVGMEVNF